MAFEYTRWCFMITSPVRELELRGKSTIRYFIHQRHTCILSGTTYLQGYMEFRENVSATYVMNVLGYIGTNVSVKVADEPSIHYISRCKTHLPSTYGRPMSQDLPEVQWHWGVAHSGKTRNALAQDKHSFVMYNGYDLRYFAGEETIVLDGYSSDWMRINILLGLLTGKTLDGVKRIIVTSRESPLECYSDMTSEDIYSLCNAITKAYQYVDRYDKDTNPHPLPIIKWTSDELIADVAKIDDV